MAKGSDASNLLWHYVTALLSKTRIPPCPSHFLVGQPLISVVEEHTLSQSIYNTSSFLSLLLSGSLGPAAPREGGSVADSHCFRAIWPAVSCTDSELSKPQLMPSKRHIKHWLEASEG